VSLELDQIGPFKVDREIGRGGMGVVYLGRDTRLDRAVAIKSLPEEVAGDADRLTRFEREARTLATVSHPNIAGIYGVEEHEGRKVLVLEFVEGETLADRLDRGPLSVDDALEVCSQIAAGVEAAHEAGVIHRDLKPGNVKITPDGEVKVLDFGLAKTSDASSSSIMQTVTTPSPQSPTVPGAVLGTAPYMSPEQARGRRVDLRSDIWSFGVILYECLAGASPFVGETVTDSIGAILHAQPDWARLPADTPPTIQLLLRRCLQRDRKRRLQNVGDARIELELALEDPTASSLILTGGTPGVRGRRPTLAMGLALLAVPILVGLGAAAAWLTRPAAAPPQPLQLAVPIPPRFADVLSFDLAPDGQTLAVVAQELDEDQAAIYLRDLSNDGYRELPGTRGASFVLFTQSGRRVFFARPDDTRPMSEVRSVSVDAGPVLTAYRGEQSGLLRPWGLGPLSDNEVLAISQDGHQLFLIPAGGGTPHPVAQFEWPENDRATVVSAPRPGGRYALVTRVSIDEATGRSTNSLHRVDLDTGETTLLIDDADRAQYVEPGGLAFRRRENLFFVPFDLERCELDGSPEARLSEFASVRVSRRGGHLAYVPADEEAANASLVVMDASGGAEPVLEGRRGYGLPRVSPDGRRIAFTARSGPDEPLRVWVLDITSGLARPVTPEGEPAWNPTWTPAGRIAYVRPLGTHHRELFLIDPGAGTSPERPLVEADGRGDQGRAAFSPDGQYAIMAYNPYDGREPGLYLVKLGDADSARPFFASPLLEGFAAFSPDGRWVAYHTNGSGRFEVYLRPFRPEDPEAAPIYPVSSHGGQSARWSADGATLYYRGGPDEDEYFAVSVETEPQLQLSEPRRVLENVTWEIDVLPDDRFVVVKRPETASDRPEIRIILNWLGKTEG
jgi:dipeptidyl aminopeptidase/acylaminoacyl peptidase/predicted Ser/Thr protein kinase